MTTTTTVTTTMVVLPGTSTSTMTTTDDKKVPVPQQDVSRRQNDNEGQHHNQKTNDDNHHDHDKEQQHQESDTNGSSSGNTTMMMIGLYYYYFSNGHIISSKKVQEHVEFQKQLVCTLSQNVTGGRIRVCREGLNGVLSGTREALKDYEHALEDELKRIEADNSKEDNNAHEDNVWLDMKYCYLRSDLSIEEQLFKEWSIKSTSEVVSLHVGGDDEEVNGKHNRSRKKKKKKKNKGTLYPYGTSSSYNNNHHHNIPTTANATDCIGTENTTVTTDKDEEETTTKVDNTVVEETTVAPNNDNNNNDDNARLNSTPTTNNNYKTKYIPAQHLSPEEWHSKLLSKSNAAGTHDDTHNYNNDDSIILVDARNVYESRVGYFEVPNTTTLLTNTRKYSDLPHVLEQNLDNFSNKHVMMYCTGGVRCERASQYLQSLFDTSTNDASQSTVVAPPKGIYQLKGGIQRYLEQYGRNRSLDEANNNNEEEEQKTETDQNDGQVSHKNDNGNDKDTISNGPPVKEHKDDDDNDYNGTKQEEEETNKDNDETTPNEAQNEQQQECFFKGKNFVFDPRRLDPVFNQKESVVGRCLICDRLHDDYDNGSSPLSQKEARCCRCRILILICNTCRLTHTCWGEISSPDKQNVYCGPNGSECIDEGNLCSTT